jgi:murein DD-endopeptidase MepM/ murein hydrolase activator NlpD
MKTSKRNMKKQLTILIVLFTIHFSDPLLAQNNLVIRHKPENALKETSRQQTFANFDLIIENLNADTLTLQKIEVEFLNKQNKLLQEKYLDNNGTAPGIQTIPNRNLNGAYAITVFNPFAELKYEETHKMHFTFTFRNNKANEFVVKHEVPLYDYKQPMSFILPLSTKLLVYDGHDLNSHHRRFDTEFQPIKELGFTSNMMRYAYDLIVVDNNGRKFKNDGKSNQDWLGWGTDVKAIAAGKIEAVVFSEKDNKEFKIEELKSNPMVLFGNYVVIKHSEGIYSLYGHLMENSSRHIKIGDTIKAGEKLGAIGVSGSSFIPHLHLQVQNGLEHGAEGLPSYFSNFYFVRGDKKQAVNNEMINTGDIVLAK